MQFAVESATLDVSPQLEPRIMRHEIGDCEWGVAANYLAFFKLTRIRIWLRACESAPWRTRTASENAQ
jgi:hypothetical protein